MRRFIDRTGERFGKLVVVGLASMENGTWFRCRCDCGNEHTVRRQSLVAGQTRSCGCMHRVRTHGRSKEPEYRIWKSIKQRTLVPTYRDYPNYGGRGITIHPTWAKSYVAFIDAVGRRPSPSHMIERIDNDVGYVPGNVVWATRKDQNNNTRKNRFVEIAGERMTVAQAADKYGISQSRLLWRLNNGWRIDDAVTLPTQRPYLTNKRAA